jgi:transposase InsO family protein
MNVARSALKYRSKLAVKDAPAMSRMSELAAQYPRYGCRQVRIFLARDGHHMGTDRAYRLWKRAGLQVPRRKARRRVAASRPRPIPSTGPNHVWAYDFVFDTCATGQQIKCLTVVDEWTREALAIDVAGSIRSGRVIDVLAKLVSARGAPRYLRSDNGPEFVSIKTHLLDRQESIRSKTPEGVRQELWGIALAYNLVRVEMERAAAEAGVPPTRISFVASLAMIRDEFLWLGSPRVTPGAIPASLARLRMNLKRLVLPPRRSERSYPRAVKVKMSTTRASARRREPLSERHWR